MNIRLKRLLPALFALAVAVMLVHPPGARAETTDCDYTIDSSTTIPYTISDSGIHCFTENVSTSITSGAAIKIEASDVVLDLNAHLLDGSSSSSSYGIHIEHASDPTNVIVKNGTIRGFLQGVHVNAASGHLIEDLTLDGNTSVGIYLAAIDSTIRNNRVIDTGPTSGSSAAYGIYIYSANAARVLGNDVVNTHASGTGFAIGIRASGSDNCFFLDNRVSDTSSGSGTVISLYLQTNNGIIEGNSARGMSSSGQSTGISINSSGADVVNNRVSGSGTGTSYGFWFSSSGDRFRDNIASNVTTKYGGVGRNLGNND